MEIVYLGGFVQLLQDILGGLFDAVLSPVLRDVFSILVNIFGKMIHEVLSNFLLKLWIILLKLIGFLEGIFNVFSGVSNVEVKVNNVSTRISLLEYFFRLGEVQKAFLVITAMAVVLAFLATAIGVAKSISDMALENKNPLSTVFKQAFSAALNFLMIPIACLFVLQMSGKVVLVFNTTFNYEHQDAAISDGLFIITAGPAIKDTTKISQYSLGQRYENGDDVKKDFNIDEINFLQAYLCAGLMALILLCSILQFIQRLIVILVLYLTSPFFVAMIPLDGGAKFREWKNMFAAYMLSAFGPILSMKVFLLVIPMVTGAAIDFGVSADTAAWLRLFFVIGGAFAVYKSRLLFVSVINPSAAGSMAESGVIGAVIGGKISGGLSRMAKGGKGGKSQKRGGGSQASSNQYKTQSQAYTGK